MNDSFDNYDMFSNKSYSDKKNLFMNLLSLNDLNSKNPLSSHNYYSNVNEQFFQANNNRNYNLNQSSGSKTHLEEIFKCFICFGRVKNAQMCPHCSKLCCNNCIKKWLTEQKSQCPHCRASLRVSQLVNCRFVSEITSALDNMSIKKEEEEELCKTHKNRLQYYCTTCQTAICSDCAMIGYMHKGHEFEHISKTYDLHVEKIKKESYGLSGRLKDLNENLNLIQNAINTIKKNKEEKSTEISLILEQMSQKLESELKSKLVVLISQKNSVSDEIEFLDNMKNELDTQIKESPKNILISKSEDLIQMLKEINSKPCFKFNSSGLNFNFKSELVPDYDYSSFLISNYSKLRKTKDIIYSETLQKNGLVWRLKIYPNGNGVAKGTYLSIFLELVKGLQSSAKYEYRIEMVNQKNPEVCVIREFASDFESGECWGYNRFFKIEFLEKDGYLTSENDSIMIKYYVRALNFYQKATDQENYIKQLENERNEYMEKLKEFQNKNDNIVVKNEKKNSDIPENKLEFPTIKHEEEEKEEIKKVNSNSGNLKENEKNLIKMQDPKQEFNNSYLMNLNVPIESVKNANLNSVSFDEQLKALSKKNSNSESQPNLSKIKLNQIHEKESNQQIFDFQSYESKNSFSQDQEEDEAEEDNEEKLNENSEQHENYENLDQEEEMEMEINFNQQEKENSDVFKEECHNETEPDNYYEEETKMNKPERESKESMQAYLKTEIHEEKSIKDCIFETGNMAKDSQLLLNEDFYEKHFISLDSICEKDGKLQKEDSFKEKKDNKSHIRNLLPNFEKEAKNQRYENNNNEEKICCQLNENAVNEEKQTIQNKNKKCFKINPTSIALSENLIKKIENIKFYNQKTKNRNGKSKEQKENVRSQENQDFPTETNDNIQTC